FLDAVARGRRLTSLTEGLRVEARLQQQLADAMRDFDALLCPTAGLSAFPAGEDLAADFEVDGVRFEDRNDATLAVPFNIANRCPVLAVPSGHACNGVPTGVQLVGHPYDDAAVFRLGKELERVRPWAFTPDHRPVLPVV